MSKEYPYIFRVCKDGNIARNSDIIEYGFADKAPDNLEEIERLALLHAETHNKMCVVYKPVVQVAPRKMPLRRSKK